MNLQSHTQQSPEMRQHLQECIRLCYECAQTCDTCATECIRMDMPGMAECIAACLDCSDTCLLDARLMNRNSNLHFQTCAVCADACELCASACNRAVAAHDQGQNVAILQQCADACQRCAQSCRAMAGMQQAMH